MSTVHIESDVHQKMKGEASKLDVTIGELVTSLYKDWVARDRPDLKVMVVPKRRLELPPPPPVDVDPYTRPPFWAQKGIEDGTG